MTVGQRLVAGALAFAALGALTVGVLAARAASEASLDATAAALEREGRIIALQWTATAAPDEVADAAAAGGTSRVTLIAKNGSVVGDSDFDGAALARLDNHGSRPEVIAAATSGAGRARRVSASTGTEQLYVAVVAPRGIVRVSHPLPEHAARMAALRGRIATAVFIALGATLLLAAALARPAVRPVVQLRDAARALAAGDLAARPALSAPGELGEIAAAVHRLAGTLSASASAERPEEALMAALLDALDEGVVAIDARLRVVRINESARRLFKIRGPVPFPVDHLSRDRILRDALARALRGQETETLELTFEDRFLALTARPLAGGGAVLTLLDTTPARRLESMRRDFVANVSHELKTPLTILTGYAETLLDPELPAASRQQFAATIRAHARRMQRLVDDLLDLSRIESGGWVPAPALVDVRAVASEALGPAQATASAKAIALDVALDPAATHLRADPTALRQIIANLAENAVRHTSNGGVTVFTVAADGGVWLGVRDTGSGIAMDHLPRIFERFYRVDAGRSREEGGTGLGLSIVKHLAEAHGGRARAESVIGRGTTIEVFFPSA